jgi:hypothetical protein
LLSYIIAWEVLLGSSGRDTAQWVSLRATRLLSSLTSENPQSVLNFLRRAFSARNSFLHDGIIDPRNKELLEKAFPVLLRYLSKSIVCIAALMEYSDYTEIMTKLDIIVVSTSIAPLDKQNNSIKTKLTSSGF